MMEVKNTIAILGYDHHTYISGMFTVMDSGGGRNGLSEAGETEDEKN